VAVTDTLKTREAYEQAGVPPEQAAAMAHIAEEHAQDIAARLQAIFAADFARLETVFERTARDQLKWIIGITVGSVAFGVTILGLILGCLIRLKG